MKQYDLLVVGNGFDLHLGLPTTYENFIEWFAYNHHERNSLLLYFQIACSNNVFESEEWNSFEKNICTLIEFLHYICNPNNASITFKTNQRGIYDTFTPFIKLKLSNGIPHHFYRFLSNYNPFDDFLKIYWIDNNKQEQNIVNKSIKNEEVFGIEIRTRREYYNKPLMSEVEHFLISDFNDVLNRAELILKTYIRNVTSKSVQKTPFLIQNFPDKFPFLISFNYSNTAQKLFDINPNNISYVHGDINSEIVLGIEENMLDYQTVLENSKYNVFFKRSRRIIKDCNKDFNKKVLDNINNKSNLAIIGHSLDLSDRSIFKMLFSLDFNHCDIYCYGDLSDYKSKFVRLIGIDRAELLVNKGKIDFISIQ